MDSMKKNLFCLVQQDFGNHILCLLSKDLGQLFDRCFHFFFGHDATLISIQLVKELQELGDNGFRLGELFNGVEEVVFKVFAIQLINFHRLNTVKQFPESEAIVAQLLELFDKLDTNESGVVTKEEVKAAVEELTQIFAQQAKDLMAEILLH